MLRLNKKQVARMVMDALARARCGLEGKARPPAVRKSLEWVVAHVPEVSFFAVEGLVMNEGCRWVSQCGRPRDEGGDVGYPGSWLGGLIWHNWKKWAPESEAV